VTRAEQLLEGFKLGNLGAGKKDKSSSPSLDSITIVDASLKLLDDEYASILRAFISGMISNKVVRKVLKDSEENGPALKVNAGLRAELDFNFDSGDVDTWSYGVGSIKLNWVSKNVQKKPVDVGIALYDQNGYIADKLIKTYNFMTADSGKVIRDIEKLITRQ
jgi:hypothetical protein